MNPFDRRAGIRIAAVSVLLAMVARPLAWFVARETVETNTASMAVEESQRLVRHFNANALQRPNARQHAYT